MLDNSPSTYLTSMSVFLFLLLFGIHLKRARCCTINRSISAVPIHRTTPFTTFQLPLSLYLSSHSPDIPITTSLHLIIGRILVI